MWALQGRVGFEKGCPGFASRRVEAMIPRARTWLRGLMWMSHDGLHKESAIGGCASKRMTPDVAARKN